MTSGYVYFLSNKAMPDLIKIGEVHTPGKNPYDRARELYSTGVPCKFTVEFFIQVDNSKHYEKKIHSLLNGHRFNKSREFFNIQTDTLRNIIESTFPDIIINNELHVTTDTNTDNTDDTDNQSSELNIIQSNTYSKADNINTLIEADDISTSRYEELINKYIHCETSDCEVVQIQKHFYKQLIGINILNSDNIEYVYKKEYIVNNFISLINDDYTSKFNSFKHYIISKQLNVIKNLKDDWLLNQPDNHSIQNHTSIIFNIFNTLQFQHCYFNQFNHFNFYKNLKKLKHSSDLNNYYSTLDDDIIQFVNYNTSTNVKKLYIIKNILSTLGFNNCYDNSKLDYDTFHKNMQVLILTNPLFTDFKEIRKLFKLEYMEELFDVDNRQSCFKYINSILHLFCLKLTRCCIPYKKKISRNTIYFIKRIYNIDNIIANIKHTITDTNNIIQS